MKVCYLMPRLLPTPAGAVVGGAAVNCAALALELHRRDVEVELLACVPEDALAHVAKSPLSEILTPLRHDSDGGLLGKGLGTVRALRQGLKDRLRKTCFDVVHSHSGTYPYGIVPLVADRESSLRIHSLYCPLGANGGAYGNWWERARVGKLVLGRLDRVVAATENVQRSLERCWIPRHKVELNPMGVDTESFRPRGRPEEAKYFPGCSGAPRILFVGNASQEKGLLDLLAAVAILRDRKVPFSLVAAIENQSSIQEYSVGHDRALDFVRRCDLEKQVRFFGLVDSIADLYAESDVLIIPWKTTRGPSDYPMVVLEAMAMGNCIVSTPVGGCPDLLAGGQAGILAKGFSPVDIAAALERAIDDPSLRKRLSGAAREKVQQFSIGVSATRMIALYEELLQRKVGTYAPCAV